MSSIGKGDFVLVPREYAETVFREYREVPMDGKGAKALACSAGIEKGNEDYTLLCVCERTDDTVTLAVPMFEDIEHDYFLVLCEGSTKLDAFEKSGYIKVTDKIPFEGLNELYAHPTVSAVQLSRHLMLAWIAAGLIVFGMATFIFKINILETLVCTAVTMTAVYAFLSIIQRKVIFKNYIEKEYSRLMDTFLDLQKKYNFFYYRKGTDNGLRRRALKDAAEKTQEA